MKIRKNDMVVVLNGADAGKTGKVLQVAPSRARVLVEGVRVVKKALRKTQDSPQGGIGEKESFLAVSNVMLMCPECKKGVKVGFVKDGKKTVRKCKRCNHLFDG